MAGGRAAEFLVEATQVWVLPKGGISWVGPKAGMRSLSVGRFGACACDCAGRTSHREGSTGPCAFALADAPRGSPAGAQCSH